MRSVRILVASISLLGLTDLAIAEDPFEIIARMLSRNANVEADSSEDSIRVAQKSGTDVKSVLRLGDEKVSGSQPMPITGPSKETIAEDNEKEKERVEAGISRKMDRLEKSLKREEQLLEKRLADLGKQRDNALEKGDLNKLKRIETAEKQAVVDYERRLKRLLDSAVASGSPSPIGKPVAKRSSSTSATRRSLPTPTWNRRPTSPERSSSSIRNPSRTAAPKPDPKLKMPNRPEPQNLPPRRRRMRLWPF